MLARGWLTFAPRPFTPGGPAFYLAGETSGESTLPSQPFTSAIEDPEMLAIGWLTFAP